MNMINRDFAYDRAHIATNGRPLTITPDFLHLWAGIARPGDKITYFRGPCLIRARFAKPHIDAIADAVLDLEAAGLVAPLQRREPLETVYYIEKVSKCFSEIRL